MPVPSIGKGEIDFVLQNGRAEVVPVEVKSGRNVRARSLERFVREGRAPFAYLLSERDFARSEVGDTGCELRHVPIYAAYALDLEA